ncbi:uncharacterized protein [Magallana gigas]|uniref:uncharacterized protein n=1 Tax=Magallana gigas TaxID=29159 RepID=UPI003341F12C
MTLGFMCAILPSLSLLAYAQNIEIQAFPSTVNFRENNLVIVCSITNPSQLASVFFIQLLKNSSTLFDDVVQLDGVSKGPMNLVSQDWSSTITYNLTSQDTFTRFLCESGETGLCGTGTAIQYVNISISEWSYTTNNPTIDEGSSAINEPTTDGTSAAGTISRGLMRRTVLILHTLLAV